MSHKEFIAAYAQKMKVSEKTAQKYLDGIMEVMYPEFENGDSVTIQHLGRFYCRESSRSYDGQKIFKFTPAQKLKAILGWSSSYKG